MIVRGVEILVGGVLTLLLVLFQVKNDQSEGYG